MALMCHQLMKHIQKLITLTVVVKTEYLHLKIKISILRVSGHKNNVFIVILCFGLMCYPPQYYHHILILIH